MFSFVLFCMSSVSSKPMTVKIASQECTFQSQRGHHQMQEERENIFELIITNWKYSDGHSDYYLHFEEMQIHPY